MRKLLCLFSIAIFLHGQLFAQTVWDIFASSFSVAQQRFEAKDFHTAIELFKKDYKKRPTDITAVLIARSYYKIGEPKPTVFWYDKVQDVNNLSQNDWLQKAICFSKTGDYDKAANIYHRLDSQFPGKFSDAIHSMENIEHLYLDSLFYLVKPTNINTRFSEMSPAFYEGGIVFSSSRPGKFGKLPGAGNTELFDLYFAPFSKSGKPNEKNDFEVPVMFSQGLSSPANESNATFYKDETKMIFSSNVNDTEGGQGRLKLFSAEKVQQDWGNVSLLDINEQGASLAHPAMSSDGKRLYFASDMPGGYGGVDLYMCLYHDQGWSKPQNLGPKINSPGNEMFPYLHRDQTFYFASDGHGGLGGLDIFATYVEEDSALQLVNLGYPINSTADDFGVALDEHGDFGYFCSNRGGKQSKDDIYYLEIYKDKFRYGISGTVMLDKTQFEKKQAVSPLANLPVQVIDAQTNELLYAQNTDEKGYFDFLLPWNANYKLVVIREGGSRYQTNLHLPVNHPLDKNISIVFIPSLREIME